jgi:hypothetical protein
LQLGKADEGNLKHFVSAETALDTIEGEKSVQRVTHFALDADYLCLLVEVIVNELERLFSFASNYHLN